MTRARENIGPVTVVTLGALVPAIMGVSLYFLGRTFLKKAEGKKILGITVKPNVVSDFQQQIAEKARSALTWADYDGYCTGYVGSIFRSLGINITGRVSDMAQKAQEVGAFRRSSPRVGDIIFFGNTWDANGNGLADDWYTHVGVVLSIDEDGTVEFGHGNFNNRRTTSYLNMNKPHDPKDAAGNVINTYMRARRSSDLPGTPYLAAECVTGFATVRPEDAALWNA